MKGLSKQQQRVISDKQQQHLQQQNIGLVVTRASDRIIVETDDGVNVQCYLRRNMPEIVVGDYVAWQMEDEAKQAGTVLAVQPRESEMLRYDQQGRSKLIAANVDQLFVVAAVEPTRSISVIDRYLVLAELQKITAVIIFNKIDLLSADELTVIKNSLAIYSNIGYETLFVSSEQQDSLKILEQQLQNKVSVFVGLSGVGKSSLISQLINDADIKVGALSEQGNQGQHTTTAARLFHLPRGGNIIDSPGIRELALTGLHDVDVIKGFIEFQPFLGKCKFRDCQHESEPDCALLKAVATGDIMPERWQAYQSIIRQNLG